MSSGDDNIDLISAAGNLKEDSQYYIASINKFFVSAIILRLFKNNKLDLHDKISKFFENSFEFILMIQKEGIEKAFPLLVMKVLIETQDSDKKTRMKIAKKMMKLFPTTRETMKEMKNNLKEILE